jgi:hypothetical protein
MSKAGNQGSWSQDEIPEVLALGDGILEQRGDQEWTPTSTLRAGFEPLSVGFFAIAFQRKWL